MKKTNFIIISCYGSWISFYYKCNGWCKTWSEILILKN